MAPAEPARAAPSQGDPSRNTMLESLRSDLRDEHESLRSLLESLEPDMWDRGTASPGWSVRHQVSHLEFFDRRAVLALTDGEAFGEDRRLILAEAPNDPSVEMARTANPSELLQAWISGCGRLDEAVGTADATARVPWYGPSMSVSSFLTARLMETWAHGEDVAEAVGVVRRPTDRLRHVAHIGVATRSFCLAINGLATDDRRVDIRLRAPSGEVWEWSSGTTVPDEGPGSIAGDAIDFCRVVTQRRRAEDTALVIVGDAAGTWMSVAQAFAGPPGRRA